MTECKIFSETIATLPPRDPLVFKNDFIFACTILALELYVESYVSVMTTMWGPVGGQYSFNVSDFIFSSFWGRRSAVVSVTVLLVILRGSA